MQKVISINVVKPMIPVIKSKFNTKLERRIKEIVKRHDDSKYFFKKEIDMKAVRREALTEGICGLHYDKSFIENLELCVKNSGDIILDVKELEFLYYLFEEKI